MGIGEKHHQILTFFHISNEDFSLENFTKKMSQSCGMGILPVLILFKQLANSLVH